MGRNTRMKKMRSFDANPAVCFITTSSMLGKLNSYNNLYSIKDIFILVSHMRKRGLTQTSERTGGV